MTEPGIDPSATPSHAPPRRRRWVTAATVLAGTAALAFSLRLPAGSPWFYPATLLLAAVWAVGALSSGPVPLARSRRGRADATQRPRLPIAGPLIVGLGLAGVFLAGGLVIRELPYLGDLVDGVLDYAGEGSLPLILAVTAINGIAEELFFRGSLYATLPRPLLWTTLAYPLITLATGNVMLAFAALLLGIVVGLERRATGGVLAPIITHVSWSLTMVLALPLLFS